MSDSARNVVVAGAIVLVTLVVAKLVDRWVVRRLELTPEALADALRTLAARDGARATR